MYRKNIKYSILSFNKENLYYNTTQASIYVQKNMKLNNAIFKIH